MKVLVINAGSSSLKYQLIDMPSEAIIARGYCERIGVDGKIGHITSDLRKLEYDVPFPSHTEAFLELVKVLSSGEGRVIDSIRDISAIGHRVLHGSEKYKQATLITDTVISDIELFSELGPLHNPPQAAAMRACRKVFGPDIPMVAVFDTSFHQTMPPKAYMYALPYEYYEKYSVRRYGFHGTSHRFITARYTRLTGGVHNLITCHMGNGSSIAAVQDGHVVDTTMGFTPLDGLIMGTRCGSIDPSVVTYVSRHEGLTADEINEIMNKKSGFIGLSGVSSDCRDIHKAANEGNYRAQLTLDMLAYQVKKYIGSYAAAMGGVDALVFTGGIGENDAALREAILENMEFLGIRFDREINRITRDERRISAPDSRVDVWVIPTNEETLIARDTVELISR